MEQEVQKFLDAEETAEKLVRSLEELHTEATAYDTALKELSDVRQDLVNLIESTKQLATGSYEAIKTMRELGTPEILDRLTDMQKNTSKELTTQVADIKSKVSEELEKQFSDIQSNFNKELTTKTSALSSLKALLIVTLASSVGALAVGIVALLR